MRRNLLRLWLDPLVSRYSSLRALLDGKRILITGVSGFVGTWLTAALLRFAETGTSLQIAGVARHPGSVAERLAPFFELNPLELTAADLTKSSAPLPKADLVIHAAGNVSPGAPPEELLRSMVSSSERVVDHAGTNGTARYLFVSSGAVYGLQPASLQRISERYGGAPDTCSPDLYGNAKRWGETLSVLRGRVFGMPVVIARCFSFSGAFLPWNGRFALGNFIRDALAGGPVMVRGSGAPIRSYLDGADMALWLLAALLKGGDGRCYNVGSPYPSSIASIADTVASSTGCSVVVEGGRDGALCYVPSVERSLRELDAVPTVRLEESIRRMIEFYKESA